MTPEDIAELKSKLKACLRLLEKVTDPKTPEEIRKPSKKEEMAHQIYMVYPRKIARPSALRAICRALRKVPFQILLEKTKKFADITAKNLAADADSKRFVPHPATWFNQERYNDNPAEWVRKPIQKPIQTIQLEHRLKQVQIQLSQVSDPPEDLVKEYHELQRQLDHARARQTSTSLD